MTKRILELGGYIGMVLILSSTLPITYNIVMGFTKEYPPISMILLVDIGLTLYLLRAVAQKDLLYIIANALGITFQSILLYYIMVI